MYVRLLPFHDVEPGTPALQSGHQASWPGGKHQRDAPLTGGGPPWREENERLLEQERKVRGWFKPRCNPDWRWRPAGSVEPGHHRRLRWRDWINRAWRHGRLVA